MTHHVPQNMEKASTSPAQSRVHAKACGVAAATLGLLALVVLLAACDVDPVVSGKIETLSAVRHFDLSRDGHSDNFTRYMLGAVRSNGQIENITSERVATSYLVPSLPYLEDLSGAAFTIHMKGNRCIERGVYGCDFRSTRVHMSVLEFTFPASPWESGADLQWFVEPYLVCEYSLAREATYLTPQYHRDPEITILFDYAEDSMGLINLPVAPTEVVVGALRADEEDMDPETDHWITGDAEGTVIHRDEVLSGRMVTPPGGTQAKLFLGITVYLSVYVVDDRAEAGGEFLRFDTSSLSRCSLAVGRNSYYTMRPLAGTE